LTASAAARHADHLRRGDPLLAWRGQQPPHRSYVFMLNAVDDNYGGLEHRNSTALICGRRDLPRSASAGEGGKQPRATPPAGPDQPRVLPHLERQAPAPGRVRPLRLHAGELHRAAVVLRRLHQLLRRPAAAPRRPDRQRQYLALLTKTINQVLQTPGRQVQSVARPASTPGSSTTARTRTPPTPPSATTPRARWWPCAWTWPCAAKARHAGRCDARPVARCHGGPMARPMCWPCCRS
jgi:hypothetical protein